MVIAGDRYRSHLSKCLGDRVPELRDKLGRLVREADGIVLAACDEDLAVRKDDAVVEGAWVAHRGEGGYGGERGRVADGD